MDNIELEKIACSDISSRLHVTYSINLVMASTQHAKKQEKAPSHCVCFFSYYAAALPWSLQVTREILLGDCPIQLSRIAYDSCR